MDKRNTSTEDNESKSSADSNVSSETNRESDLHIQEACNPETSAQETLKSFIKFLNYTGMLPGMQPSGVRRSLCLTVAVIFNACLYLESVCSIPKFLKLPLTLDITTTMLVIFSLFHLYCAAVSSVYLKLSCSDRLSDFLITVDNIVASASDWPILANALSTGLTRYRRMYRRMLVFIPFIAVGNAALCILFILATPNQLPFTFSIRMLMFNKSLDDPLPTIDKAPWNQVVWQVVASFEWLYASVIWVHGYLIFFAIVYIPIHLLREFRTGLSNQASESTALSAECAAAYRHTYLKLIELVRRADSMFNMFVAFSFSFCLTVIMFNVNALLDASRSQSNVSGVLLFWIISTVVLLCVQIYVAGKILDLASKPLLELIQGLEITPRNHSEMVMLLHAVTNNGSGLSCAKLFIIDNSVIVSMTGVFLTYFILIVQTRQTSDAGTGCACSSVANSSY